ncbi:hypothetical protein GXW82_06570 [Streptacidiphilus sp. 4-A2]|nr:hypothetical protein [Streptacidiphilus sp. 4-A2]
MTPGTAIALNGGGLPFEGNYTVTGTRHVFSGAEKYQTWVTVTGRQIRSLYGLASGGADTAPKIPGVVTALVTNIQDPLHQGRVKLMFPWLSATYESDWCRIAQLGGVRGGGTFLPEVQDEVLCAFDRGSLDHPYVVAGLYNGKDQPTRTRTTTRSTTRPPARSTGAASPRAAGTWWSCWTSRSRSTAGSGRSPASSGCWCTWTRARPTAGDP